MRIAAVFCASAMAFAADGPPKTKVQPVIDSLHGRQISDPYRWLENQNAPETRAWIDEQMKYTQSVLSALPVRESIRKRLSGLMQVDAMTPPLERGGRYFFSARKAAERQSIWYLRKGLNGKDEVLIDPNKLSPDGTVSASPLDVTEDGRLMAYGLRRGGEDEVEVRFRNIDTNTDIPDVLPRTRYGSVSILNGQSGLYYSKFTPAGPRLYWHAMGTDSAKDKELFGKEYGLTDFVFAEVSDDEKRVLISAGNAAGGNKQDLWLLTRATGEIKPVVKGLPARFQALLGGPHIFIHTNYQAPNWKIMRASLDKPAFENWTTVVPEGKWAIGGFSLAGGRLVVTTLENVVPRVRILDADGQLVRELKTPGIGALTGPNGRWKSDEAYYSFVTFGRPGVVYRYNIRSAEQSIWFAPRIPFDSDSVEIKQLWFPSKDGTRVPMFVAHKKGLKLDGANPTLLTGYGGFNVPSLPSYSPLSTAFIDMGGVFALANMRGGGEFGEAWHRGGMLESKQNVFDDFFGAAEYLIAQKYTSKQKLAIMGGSNGGLLVGAAMTQRPDLFRAVICAVPLLDMLRYHQFLVARFWVAEYGSSEDPKQFEYIYRYSPYQHVEKGVKYPATLVVSGDSDTRVDPSHARKFAALLQASTGSGLPVLLHYDVKSGHTAGLPVDRLVENTADQLAFLAWQLGMK